MRITPCSLQALERLANAPFAPQTTLLSIGDPDAPPPKLKHKPAHHLRLVFDDITPQEAEERLGIGGLSSMTDAQRRSALAPYGTILFDRAMADRAAGFILRHLRDTAHLVCQCEHGQSRSVACAAAITAFLGGDNARFYDDPRFHINPYVYENLLAALKSAIQIHAIVDNPRAMV